MQSTALTPEQQQKQEQLAARWQEAETAVSEGRVQHAIALAEQVVHEAQAWGLIEPEHMAYNVLSGAYDFLGDVAGVYRSSLESARTGELLGSSERRARGMATQAYALADMGAYEEALEVAFQALEVSGSGNSPLQHARAHMILGLIYIDTHQFDLGIEHLKTARAEALKFNWRALIAPALINLGKGYLCRAAIESQQGQVEASLETLRLARAANQEALDAARELGVAHAEMLALCNLIAVLSDLGEVDAAEECAQKALALTAETQATTREALALLNLGGLRVKQGRLDEGRQILTEALNRCEAGGWATMAIDCLVALSTAAEKQGDKAGAIAYLRRHAALTQECALANAQMRARAMEIKRQTEQARLRAETERARAQKLEQDNDVLTRRNAQLAQEVQVDGLTGVLNRRGLDGALSQALTRDEGKVYIGLIDIDHFKSINDRYSHATGDQVLRRMGAVLRGACRAVDQVGRYGGEEFLIVWSDVSPAEALSAAENLRATVAACDWAEVHPDLRVTVSIGVAGVTEAPQLEELIALADQRLYTAKRDGRNRVVAGSDVSGTVAA